MQVKLGSMGRRFIRNILPSKASISWGRQKAACLC